MIPTTLNIETYKGADHDLLFEVKDSNGDPYEFTGTNTLQVFKKFAATPFLTIALTWDGTQYTGAITSTESDIDAVKYPLQWKVDNGGLISYPVKGDMAHSDVYTSNRVTVGTTLTVSTVTNSVTVDDSFTAAAAAIAAQTAAETAQTAAELAQTGAETAETNAGLSETAASGFATDALGHANDAEAAADKALSRIKDKKQVTADYTLLATDEGTMILAEHAATKINITVPNNLFTDFSDGYPVIAVRRKGLAEVEIISDGVSVIVGGANIAEQNHTVSIDWEDASTVTITGGAS